MWQQRCRSWTRSEGEDAEKVWQPHVEPSVIGSGDVRLQLQAILAMDGVRGDISFSEFHAVQICWKGRLSDELYLIYSHLLCSIRMNFLSEVAQKFVLTSDVPSIRRADVRRTLSYGI